MNKKTQIETVALLLRKYKTITSLQAFKLGILRLSGIIYNLRYKYNFGIRTEIKTVKNRYGSTSNVAIYHLEKDGEL